MALTKEGIKQVAEEIILASTEIDQFSTTLDNALNGLKNDSNYQIFISGTEIGKELNEKLEKVIELTRGMSENEAQNVIKYSNKYLQTQRDLNK